jgi:hypothetical protein
MYKVLPLLFSATLAFGQSQPTFSAGSITVQGALDSGIACDPGPEDTLVNCKVPPTGAELDKAMTELYQMTVTQQAQYEALSDNYNDLLAVEDEETKDLKMVIRIAQYYVCDDAFHSEHKIMKGCAKILKDGLDDIPKLAKKVPQPKTHDF